MGLDVALRYPARLGGLVGVSGYVFFEEEYPGAFSHSAKSQRIWVSHGRQDEVLPIDRTRTSIERLRAQGLAVEWSEYDKTHTVDEFEELGHIRAFLRRQLDAS